ncbi:aldehyde ferredoxin oxidoreductase family protein [Chloroflexota bacterium]
MVLEPMMLRIDLSNRSYKTEEIPRDVLRKYIGGRGLGAYLLYKLNPAKADPLGEENRIIFTVGPTAGSKLPFSAKMNLNTKSPLTGIYLHSVCSGTFGYEMREAGYWAIAVEGIADSPTYIVIDNQEVEFRDATPLWGMETAEAQKVMLEGFPRGKAAAVGIGPAGEQLIRYAAVFSQGSLYRCFGRGGGGCVMGSKKLKGIVMKGDGEVEIGDKNRLKAMRPIINAVIKGNPKRYERRLRYETGADLEELNALGMLPTRNWQTGQFEGWSGIDKSTTPMGWPEKPQPCAPYCLVPGCREAKVKSGPYKGAHSSFEWETIYAFGVVTGVDKMEAIVAASQLCDEFGIDTMTAGITIAFTMECFEKGLIGLKDTDGIELRFGDDKAMIAALRKLVKQEGFGKQLAKGTRRLSEEIKGSEDFAMHAKGMELGGYECRGLNGQALQFAVASRGGCHHSVGLAARRENSDGTRLDIEGKGEYLKNIAVFRVSRDCLIVCSFGRIYNDERSAEALSALFGEPWSVDDIARAGWRVITQERLFNAREGLTREDDTLPGRLLKEPKPDGPTKGAVVPLEPLKDDWYRAMGFDLATGIPTDATLAELGIEK